MLPSANSFSAFPHLSSSYNPPPYINVSETNEIFLYQHHNPLTVSLLSTNPPMPQTELNMATPSNSLMPKQHNALNGNHYSASNFLPFKQPVKKDRHSKIYTAQGLRDRRVRLSVEIARKFFDLQDMLGFDKASKTLDWLLNKSKKAIKELAQNGCAKSLSSPSACDGASENGNLEERLLTNEQLSGVSDEKRMKKLKRSAVNLVAKESRAKARARARERTRMKMCTRGLHDSRRCPDTNPHMLNQSRSWGQHQVCDKSHASYISSSLKVIEKDEKGPSSHSLANQVPKENSIEESIVIKRKSKLSTTMVNQQNLAMSQGASCNNYLTNLAQNWEINNTIALSRFSAVANTNLSAELQLYGKFLEAETKRYQH